ncbi:MAG: hypothetical protein DRN66_00315 [Candidatus Nanohalarchaeota archaeon]|nr:MAG: hypothetical protein DRN66_00315 [Candidatus Nanohaloarchaeota archaeon]
MLNEFINLFGKNPVFDGFVVFFLFCMIGLVVNFLLEKILLHLAGRTKTNIDDKIIHVLKKPLYISFVLAGFFFSIRVLGASGGKIAFSADILKTMALLIWMLASFRLSKILMSDIVPKIVSKTKTKLDDELLPLAKNILNLIIIFLFMGVFFMIWDIDIAPLLASAGIAGFAIAFAAKDTLGNVFGGLSVYADKPFKVGNRIKLEDGDIGDVVEIGLRSTRIKTFDETMIIIPNSVIANSKIINYDEPKANIKVKIPIGVEYGTNIELVKKTLLKCAKNVDIILDEPKASVFFTNHGDWSLDFVLITWVESPYKQFEAKDKLNTQINREFKKAGIGIPFPVQTVYRKEIK